MKALGRVINTKSNTVHKVTCSRARFSNHTKPLSTIPAPKRRGLSLCRVCKP
jgi:hypothetical protein